MNRTILAALALALTITGAAAKATPEVIATNYVAGLYYDTHCRALSVTLKRVQKELAQEHTSESDIRQAHDLVRAFIDDPAAKQKFCDGYNPLIDQMEAAFANARR